MKIALYIEDGLEQIVLTPESDTERGVIGKLSQPGERRLEVRKGQFYQCQGGYLRQGPNHDSTILVLREPPRTPEPFGDAPDV